MTAWTAPTKSSTVLTPVPKSSASVLTPVSKTQAITYFQLLIDGTYKLLIDSTYHLRLGDSASTGPVWTAVPKS